MPITRRQFELEIDAKTEEWMKKIHGFFTEHKDEAFSKEELRQYYSKLLAEHLPEKEREMVLSPDTQFDAFYFLSGEASAFNLALERLVGLEVLDKSIIRSKNYYAYRDELKKVL